jgi:hypothetical protein
MNHGARSDTMHTDLPKGTSMNEDVPPFEFFENEWDLPKDLQKKSPHTRPAKAALTTEPERCNSSASYFASLGSWLSGWLSR